MSVGNTHAATIALFFSKTQSIVNSAEEARCEVSDPYSDACSHPQYTSNPALFLQPGGSVSGAVGTELSSGIHMGGNFQDPMSSSAQYSPFIYFGDAEVEGSVRIGGAKPANGTNADTAFVSQIKKDIGGGVLAWRTVSINEFVPVYPDPF